MSRCRVCHRELKSADAIAKGIGPVCEAKQARLAGVRSADAQAAKRQPEMTPERYARIRGAVKTLGEMGLKASRYLAYVNDEGTQDEQREAVWQLSLIRHWYDRLARMEHRAAKLLRRAGYDATIA